MKEAIKVNLDGLFVEPVLVPISQSGITELKDLLTSGDGTDQEETLTGYIVAEKVPEGFYLPRWDFTRSVWVEGRTQDEIDEIRKGPSKRKTWRRFWRR